METLLLHESVKQDMGRKRPTRISCHRARSVDWSMCERSRVMGVTARMPHRLRQLVGIIAVQRYPAKRESDAWVNDTDGGELVGTVGSLVGISPSDLRFAVAIVQPVVNVHRNVDGSCEQPVAGCFVEYSIADAVELIVDRVRVKSTKMVQQCSRQRIP